MFLCYRWLYSNQDFSISICICGAGIAIRLRHVPVLQTASCPSGTDALSREVSSAIQARKYLQLAEVGPQTAEGLSEGALWPGARALPEAGC